MSTRPPSKRWRWIAVVTLLAGLLWLYVLRDRAVVQTLPDGTAFALRGLKVGSNNVYVHGTLLSRLAAPLIPSNGLHVASYHLERPERVSFNYGDGTELLSAELQLLPGSPREHDLLVPGFFRRYRLRIGGEDGFAYVTELRDFKVYPDGIFAHFMASRYPRTSERLQFRFEERTRGDTNDWRGVMTLNVANPKPATIESWKVDQAPHFDLPGGLTVDVGELVVTSHPHPRDIWENAALLSVQIRRDGTTVTNWGLQYGPVHDAAGNRDGFTFSPVVANNWMIYQIFRPLDPQVPWRFDLRVSRVADFPATNLWSFTVPWPMPADLKTNFNERPPSSAG